MSFMDSALGWSCHNKVIRTTLSCAWAPCSMDMVTVKETPSGAVSMAASDNEGGGSST